MSKWLTMHQTTAKADKGLHCSCFAAHTAARHVFLAAGVARPQRDSAINFQSRLTRAGQLRRIAELRQASVACRLFSCGNEKSWRQLISWCANQRSEERRVGKEGRSRGAACAEGGRGTRRN